MGVGCGGCKCTDFTLRIWGVNENLA